MHLCIFCTNGFGLPGGSGQCCPTRQEAGGEGAKEKREHSVEWGWLHIRAALPSSPQPWRRQLPGACPRRGFWVHAAPLAMGYVIVCAPSPCRGMVRCKLYGSRCLFIPLYSLSCSSFDSYITNTLFVVPFVIFSHFLMVCYTEILLFDKGT